MIYCVCNRNGNRKKTQNINTNIFKHLHVDIYTHIHVHSVALLHIYNTSHTITHANTHNSLIIFMPFFSTQIFLLFFFFLWQISFIFIFSFLFKYLFYGRHIFCSVLFFFFFVFLHLCVLCVVCLYCCYMTFNNSLRLKVCLKFIEKSKIQIYTFYQFSAKNFVDIPLA